MKVSIYNDCWVPKKQPHFGCELVMETFKEQLERTGHEFVGSVKLNDRNNREPLDKSDLVIVNGEGSFHHNRRNDILEIGKNYNAILINTVYQENTCNGLLKNFRYISTRESFSRDAMLKENPNQGLNVQVIPDVIFTNKRLNEFVPTRTKDYGHIRHFINSNESDMIKTLQHADTFLPLMGDYKTISTVSYHSIIIAYMFGIGIREVISSNTHKNESIVHDCQKFGGIDKYIEKSQTVINNLFDNLEKFA